VCGDNVHKLNTFGGDWAGDEIVFCSKECARAALLDSSITQLIEVIEGVIGGQE
jgi:hypothetical protein